MKWMPSGVGAEPKKLVILGVLVAALGIVYYANSGPSLPPQAIAQQQARASNAEVASAAASAPKATVAPRPATTRAVRVGTRGASDDYRPSVKPPEGLDLTTVDPTLKLNLLARVRGVDDVGGRRSLFEYYTPPPPPPPPIKVNPSDVTPIEAPPTTPPKPVKQEPPPPPPIPLKFYGYEGRPGDSTRRAFFVDGEEHFVVAEGDMIRDRYKVVRIGVNSLEVEDTVAKNTQTLQIVPLFDPQ